MDGGRLGRWVAYLAGCGERGDGLGTGQRGARPQLALQEHLLPTGIAPHPQGGQVHRQVVPRVLRRAKR